MQLTPLPRHENKWEHMQASVEVAAHRADQRERPSPMIAVSACNPRVAAVTGKPRKIALRLAHHTGGCA